MIKKLTLIGVMGVLCFFNKGAAQNLEIKPFQIGERLSDLPLRNIINYQGSVPPTLSSIGSKIVIIDFWDTHCTTCIKMFPLEDSLQTMFTDDVQFILVTRDSRENAISFLEQYKQKHRSPLGLPIIFDDNLFHKLFQFIYIPHYVWIAPNGQILAQTSHAMVSLETLKSVIAWSKSYISRIRSYNLPENKFVYPPVSQELQKFIQQINN